ncbi:MAG: right-handed parallel beta-helix repeat-containing protein, partial [Bacteroidia bacterium]|nr:right-handed parallel beta-helix repeat-containing protein [Bacteroidia bacterium]
MNDNNIGQRPISQPPSLQTRARAGYSGTNEIKGNLSLTQNSASVIGNGGGTLLFNGTSNQSITKNGSANPEFGKLSLNKSAGYVSLNSHIKVNTSLTLTAGVLKTNGNTLNLANSSSVNGASDASYVEGAIKKTGNQAFTFPTGKSGKYIPVAISAPGSSTDAFTAEYFNTNANASYSFASAEAGLSDFDTTGYWMLSRTTGNSTPNVSLGWHSTGCGFINPNTLKVAQWNGSQWLNKGNNSYTSSSITANSINSFGPFVVSKLSALKVNAGNDTSFCAGSSVGLSTSLSNGTAPFTYAWSPATGLSSATVSNPTASPASTTTYTVSVTDARGCTASDAVVVVTVNALPVADAGNDTTIYAGDTVQIGSASISGNSYSWSSVSSLSNGSIANPYAFPTDTSMFELTVTSIYGCISRDTVVLNVYPVGFTCSNSIFLENNSSIDIVPNFNEIWFQFNALDTNSIISFITQDSLFIDTIIVYQNCDNITVNVDYYRSGCQIGILAHDLNPLQNYFVKVVLVNEIGIRNIKIFTNNNCSYPLHSTVLTNPFSSTTSITPSSTYIIDGVFTIDVISFYTGNTFILLPGAKILVNAFSTFTNCILKGCDKQWQGVFLKDNIRFSLINSTIEDAEYGVHVGRNDRIIIDNSIFKKCFYGMFIDLQNVDPSTVHFSNNVIFDGGGNSGLKPKYTGESNDPYNYLRSKAAIFVRGHPGFTLNQDVTIKNSVRGIEAINSNLTVVRTKFENILMYANYQSSHDGSAIAMTNVSNNWLKVWGFGNASNATPQFTNCLFGINSVATNISVRWCKMTGIKNDGILICNINNLIGQLSYNNIASEKYGIRSMFSENPQSLNIYMNVLHINNTNSMLNCSVIPTGIFVNNWFNAGNTHIFNNTINLWRSKYGIYLNNASKIKVYDNEIIMKDGLATGTGENCPTNVAPNEMNIKYGIYCTNTNDAEIRDNLIYTVSSVNWFFLQHRAFYQGLCNNNLIKCNVTDNTFYGFDFMGVNANTLFKGNTINRHLSGIQIENNSYIGLQTHHGNQWPYNSSSDYLLEARNDFYLNGYQYSKFLVHNNTSNYWPYQQYGLDNTGVLSDISGSGWFLVAPGDPFSCSASGPNKPKSLDASEDSVFHGHLLDSTYNNSMTWEATRGLLRRVQYDTELQDSVAGLDTFYTSQIALSPGLFLTLEDSLNSAKTWKRVDEVATYANYTDSVLNLLYLNDSLLADSTLTDSVIANLEKQRIDYLAQLNLSDSLSQLAINQEMTEELSKIANASIQNSSINVTQVYESNAKTVADIYIRTVAVGVDTIGEADKAALEEIIWQCPKSGGHAVYQARALYYLVNDSIIFNDSLFC